MQASASNPIEVESRFRVTPEAQKTILLHAGPCKQIQFTDRYFCEQLALSDKWLRMRDHAWQIKVPVKVDSSSRKGSVVYEELVGAAALEHVSKCGFETKGMDVYACITTVRTIWDMNIPVPWGSYAMQVTADECHSEDGFQYNIGEIEVLVQDKDEVGGASKAIEHARRELGLEQVDESGGKLIRYLSEKKPALYEKLRSKGLT